MTPKFSQLVSDKRYFAQADDCVWFAAKKDRLTDYSEKSYKIEIMLEAEGAYFKDSAFLPKASVTLEEASSIAYKLTMPKWLAQRILSACFEKQQLTEELDNQRGQHAHFAKYLTGFDIA